MDQISFSFENSAEQHYKATCQLQKAMPHAVSTLLTVAMLFIIIATILGAVVAFHGNADLNAREGGT